MSKEIERLQKVKEIGESVARLPSVCIDDLKSKSQIEEAKSSAIHSAVDQIRGRDYD